MSGPTPPTQTTTQLAKQHSWSPDIIHNETWSRREVSHKLRRRRHCQSVTDDDLDELEACFELGFRFDSPNIDPKLSHTFRALELYQTVNKHYTKTLSRTSSASTVVSDCDTPTSTDDSPKNLFKPGDNPETVKTTIRQWARVVACAVRQSSAD